MGGAGKVIEPSERVSLCIERASKASERSGNSEQSGRSHGLEMN